MCLPAGPALRALTRNLYVDGAWISDGFAMYRICEPTDRQGMEIDARTFEQRDDIRTLAARLSGVEGLERLVAGDVRSVGPRTVLRLRSALSGLSLDADARYMAPLHRCTLMAQEGAKLPPIIASLNGAVVAVVMPLDLRKLGEVIDGGEVPG